MSRFLHAERSYIHVVLKYIVLLLIMGRDCYLHGYISLLNHDNFNLQCIRKMRFLFQALSYTIYMYFCEPRSFFFSCSSPQFLYRVLKTFRIIQTIIQWLLHTCIVVGSKNRQTANEIICMNFDKDINLYRLYIKTKSYCHNLKLQHSIYN